MAQFSREDVKFDSGDSFCAGWLYKPTGVESAPVIVLCHGLGAVREMRLGNYAERFAAAGIAVLNFTYRHFGDSGGEPRQLLDIKRQQDDIEAALKYVKTLPGIDPERVGLFGTSFGGGHVIAVGSRHRDLKAVIAQCPFTDGQASGLTLGLTSTLKVGAYGAADKVSRALGRGPVYAMLGGKRGDPAMMTADDVVDGYFGLAPEGFEHDNRVAAGIALDVTFYRPGKKMKDLHCPTLVCACENDTVAPYKQTAKFATEAPMVELKSYPTGHFDIYMGDDFEVAIADQIEFLKRTLVA